MFRFQNENETYLVITLHEKANDSSKNRNHLCLL